MAERVLTKLYGLVMLVMTVLLAVSYLLTWLAGDAETWRLVASVLFQGQWLLWCQIKAREALSKQAAKEPDK